MLALHSSNYIKGLLTLCEMKNKPISSAIPDCLGWYLHLQSWEKEQGLLTYPLVISPLLFPVQTKVAGLMSPQNGGKWNFHQQYFQQVGRDKAGALRDRSEIYLCNDSGEINSLPALNKNGTEARGGRWESFSWGKAERQLR